MYEYFCNPDKTPIVLNTEIKRMEYGHQLDNIEILADVTCKKWNIQVFSNGTCPSVLITPPEEIQYYIKRAEYFMGSRNTSAEHVRQTIETIVRRRVYLNRDFERENYEFLYSYNESYDYLGFRSSHFHTITNVCYKEWSTEEVLLKACEFVYEITNSGSSNSKLQCMRDFDDYVRNTGMVETVNQINKDEFFMLLNSEYKNVEGEI